MVLIVQAVLTLVIIIAVLTRRGIRNSQGRVPCTVCTHPLCVVFLSLLSVPHLVARRKGLHHSKQRSCAIHQRRNCSVFQLRWSKREDSLTSIAEHFQTYTTSLLKNDLVSSPDRGSFSYPFHAQWENDEIKPSEDRTSMWGDRDENDGDSYLLEQKQK